MSPFTRLPPSPFEGRVRSDRRRRDLALSFILASFALFVIGGGFGFWRGFGVFLLTIVPAVVLLVCGLVLVDHGGSVRTAGAALLLVGAYAAVFGFLVFTRCTSYFNGTCDIPSDVTQGLGSAA